MTTMCNFHPARANRCYLKLKVLAGSVSNFLCAIVCLWSLFTLSLPFRPLFESFYTYPSTQETSFHFDNPDRRLIVKNTSCVIVGCFSEGSPGSEDYWKFYSKSKYSLALYSFRSLFLKDIKAKPQWCRIPASIEHCTENLPTCEHCVHWHWHQDRWSRNVVRHALPWQIRAHRHVFCSPKESVWNSIIPLARYTCAVEHVCSYFRQGRNRRSPQVGKTVWWLPLLRPRGYSLSRKRSVWSAGLDSLPQQSHARTLSLYGVKS